MKKLIVMTIGVALIRQVAKYFKINSFEDLVNLVKPLVKDAWPQAVHKVQKLSHSLN